MSERRRVEAAASELLQKLGVKSLPETLVVLGSGFREFAKVVKNPKRLSFRDVGGMPSPGVAGHGAEILVGSVVHKKKIDSHHCFYGTGAFVRRIYGPRGGFSPARSFFCGRAPRSFDQCDRRP